MERFILNDFEKWRLSKRRKPLLLQGARQVGKTWAILEFGARAFDQIAYINFLEDETMKTVFEGDLDPERLIDAILVQTGASALTSNTLLVFDEVQECPRALTSLKMFAERASHIPIIAAGSLLGVSLHHGVSFPVGKVDHLTMYPMTFEEFLLAKDAALAKVLREQKWDLAGDFSARLIDMLKRYYFVGGMPEAVSVYVEDDDYNQVREVQRRLIFDYEHDFSKYATAALTEKIRMIWESAPAQLGRENKKFIYSAVRKGARARGYEEAIQWLVDAGLLLRINQISKPGVPLKAYQERDVFKLYLLDVGLLGAACDLDASTLLEGNALFAEFKGALTENYVCQQLVAQGRSGLSYWSSEHSDAEVDFIYESRGKVCPLEVKAELNLRSKSLRSFSQKYEIERSYRLSLADYKKQDWVTNIPLYEPSRLP